MAVGAVFVVFFLTSIVLGPAVVFGGLRSWFCGTCTVCQVCPSCEPHLNISPKCECHENLNNCNCDCITHNNLQKYHDQWNSQLLVNQQNLNAAQQNSHQFKRRLLFWILGVAGFAVFLLFLIIVLIACAPTLFRRCSKWKLTSLTKCRQRFMQKYNLIERPSSLVVDVDAPCPPLQISTIEKQPVSYSELLKTFDHRKQLISHYQQALPAEQASRKFNPSTVQSSIF